MLIINKLKLKYDVAIERDKQLTKKKEKEKKRERESYQVEITNEEIISARQKIECQITLFSIDNALYENEFQSQ